MSDRPPMKRKIAAILAADVVGYSRLVAQDEEDTLARLASYREVFQDFVAKAGGRVFNTAGDAVLAEFPSAVEAVRCAIDIQESMRTRNLGFPPDRVMLFRIGVTIGDVVERAGDLLGDGVNIAARLEGIAQPGGICVSRGVYEQVANKISVAFRDIGAQEVKNIPQPVHAFVVELKNGEIARRAKARPEPPRASRRSASSWLLLASAVGALCGALVLGLLWSGKRPGAPADQAQSPDAKATVADASKPVEAKPVEAKPVETKPAETRPVEAKPVETKPAMRGAAELYRDARAFEAQGDAVQARRDYLALAALNGGWIDPLQRLAALVRAQDGRADARELFARLAADPGGAAPALVHAMQFDGDERRRRVEAAAQAHPDFAPGAYLAAAEASADRLAYQTIFDKRAEADGLDRFLAADAEGRLSRAFLDQSVGAEWLDRARKRRAALAPQLEATATTPTATFTPSNAGWTLAIAAPEAATSLLWRMAGAGDLVATGVTTALDSRTGKPTPNPVVQLPPASQGDVELAYDDANGRRMGPFRVAFDPRSELGRFQRDILDRFWTSWVAFGEGGREDILYYTHLVSYRCAIRAAEIAIDNGPFAPLAMPPCDPARPNEIPANMTPYLKIPRAAQSVALRLTWLDGAASAERRFERRR